MRVVISGANGQLGTELQGTASNDIELFALTREQLDVTDLDQVKDTINRIKPDLVINTAAYTKVDEAERELSRAIAINKTGAENIAKACEICRARIIHISTDYIFSGHAYRPYEITDEPDPLSVYGETKYAGEKCVEKESKGKAVILRTSWLYSKYGNNFVNTMLALFKTKDQINIVDDQIGTPTWARGLASIIWDFSTRPELQGVFHWTDSGVASWYDFSLAIQEEALALKIISKPITINPIPTRAYPAIAKRPMYSVLEKSATWKIFNNISAHWRISLREMLSEVGS